MLFLGTKKNVKVCTLGALVLIVCMVNANAATYYVDGRRGDDGNSGQSVGASWRTLGKANSEVQPGDTVCIREGTYRETIRPGTSGTQGNYITYVPYNNEEVTITDVADGADLKDRSYIVIDGLRIVNVDGNWIDMGGNSSYNIIQNCHMEEALAWGGIYIKYESHYNKILNNTVIGRVGPDDLIYLKNGPSHNVIEGNDCRYGAHVSINVHTDSMYNVVRNNRIWNPWHTSVNCFRNCDPTLIEGNIILDSGEDAANIPIGLEGDGDRQGTRECHRRYHNGIELASSDCIIRNNVLVNNGMMGMDTYPDSGLYSYNNRIYNNTFTKNYDAFYSESGNPVYGHYIKNNIFYDNYEYEIRQHISTTPGENDNYFVSNSINGSSIYINHMGGVRSLSYLQSTYGAFFHGNQEEDPLFVNPGSVNDQDNSSFDPEWLHLRSTSPMINAGAFLTTTTSSGSGTSIVVADASYFFDGWGIPGEQGDLIQLQGQTETARIVSIDYDNDRITVDRSLSWSADQGVSLPYRGSAPDIGAFEYASTETTTYALNTSGAHGTITKTPNQSSYDSGATVTVQATADDGYEFTGWSGDLSGSTNPAMITMDANKSITANFAAAAVPTYRLNTSGTHGTITRTPNQSSYDSGATVTVQATADSGYEFTGWSGDLSGSTNPFIVTMDANKSITANFTAVAPTTYTLATSGTNGWIAKTPDRSSYDSGATVTLQATADGGYEFTGWSGDLSGSTNPATVTMDGNKFVAATFAAIAPATYTLSASGTNGSVTKTPDKASYAQGETVTLTATPSAGYSFTNWSGDVSGASPSVTVTMDGNKSVTANFSINSYTLAVAGTHGSVTRSPEKDSYTHGETVILTASPDTGYGFAGWSGDLSGGTNPASVTMNGNKSIAASFTRQSTDEEPPAVVAASPEVDAVQAPRNSLVSLHISDDGDGVDADTVTISVDGETVYSGNVPKYESATGVCRRTGSKADYAYAYQSDTEFDFGETITVRVNAADLNGNAMSEHVYSFKTEMWAFGGNRKVSWGPNGLDKGRPAAAYDSAGNLWVVWDAGAAGRRDIYLSKWGPGDDSFTDPIRLTTHATDQTDPDIAIGANDKLYVAWQDNRRGNWDVYLRTSPDGTNWSAETRITDSDDNQTAPAIIADGASGCHIAWEDDTDGHLDICVASSSNGFLAQTLTRVTSNMSDQSDPDIAVDASGNVYLVWADARNGSVDIYGAASNNGPWANVALVTGAGDQSAPALATDATGARLHLVWVSDAGGDSDIYYAATEGLPSSPLAGIDLVDDSSGADQLAPTVAVTGSPGSSSRVFVCWQDWRNMTEDGQDADLYLVEVKEGDDTNVLVGDGGLGSGQSEPAIDVDSQGFPHVVWTDDRGTNTEIYYAGTTSWDSEVLDSRTVTASEGGTVGVASPSNVDDVSVVIPPAASSQDATITVTKMKNAPAVPSSGVLPYEFGPSGLQFDQPVTITIPYAVAEFGSRPPTPLWYDSTTGGLSQEGITNIEHIVLSPTIQALRFRTTHFTPYYLVSTTAMEEIAAGSGGGCSLSYSNDRSDVVAYFIPYGLIAFVMLGLRIRDARRRARLF